MHELSEVLDVFNNPVESSENPRNYHTPDSFEQFQQNRKNQTYQSNTDFGDNYFDTKIEEKLRREISGFNTFAPPDDAAWYTKISLEEPKLENIIIINTSLEAENAAKGQC